MTERTDYLVSGMTCAHCVASVTEELTSLRGVQDVAVELNPTANSTVTVSSSAPLDYESVRAAVAEAGYALVSGTR